MLNKSNRNKRRNGVNSVAEFQVQTMSGCKVLNRLVPLRESNPHPITSTRILSLLRGYAQNSTTRYQVVFTDVSAVKASYVSLGTNTYPPHLPLIRVQPHETICGLLRFAEAANKWIVFFAGGFNYSASTRCTKATAIDPSPTADATRLTFPPRTSPTAKTPGRLVSSK